MNLARLEGLVEAANEDAIIHRDVALGSVCVTGLMAALIGANVYLSQKWGVRQDIESVVGGLSMGFTILESGLMRQQQKIAREAWQTAANYFIEDEPQ